MRPRVLVPAPAFSSSNSVQEDQPVPQVEKQPLPERPGQKPAPKEPVREPPAGELWPVDLEADLRIGGWRTGSFDTFTPVGRRMIRSTLLFDTGFDLRAVSSGGSLALTGDPAAGESPTCETGGILIGRDIALESEPMPLDFQVSAGPILGRLRVDAAGFGSFKSPVGFEARVSATSWLHERIGLSLWLDCRQLSFK